MPRKVLYWLYQPYKWLFFFPFSAINTLFFGTLTLILAPVLSRRHINTICGKYWSLINAWFTPIRVTTKGMENIQRGKSYVVISNHQSYYDIWVLYGWLPLDLRFVMKKELEKVPGLGYGSKMVGHVFVDRKNPKESKETIEKAKERIKDGTCALFFPEGTRSRTGKMRSFKKGAFQFAKDLNLPVLPVTVRGTKDILPRDTMNLLPGKAEVIVHSPVSEETVRNCTETDLAEQCKAIIGSSLGEQEKLAKQMAHE